MSGQDFAESGVPWSKFQWFIPTQLQNPVARLVVCSNQMHLSIQQKTQFIGQMVLYIMFHMHVYLKHTKYLCMNLTPVHTLSNPNGKEGAVFRK